MLTCPTFDFMRRPVNVIEELVNDVTSSLDAHLVLKQESSTSIAISEHAVEREDVK